MRHYRKAERLNLIRLVPKQLTKKTNKETRLYSDTTVTIPTTEKYKILHLLYVRSLNVSAAWSQTRGLTESNGLCTNGSDSL